MDEKKPGLATKHEVELFDCLLRHGGNKDHEIPKQRVTAREITLLRAMHGDNAVLDKDVKPHMDRKTGKQAVRAVDPKTELFELARAYANTSDPMSGKKTVEKVFGTALIGFDKWLEEARELEEMEAEEARQRRQADAAAFRREQQQQQAA